MPQVSTRVRHAPRLLGCEAERSAQAASAVRLRRPSHRLPRRVRAEERPWRALGWRSEGQIRVLEVDPLEKNGRLHEASWRIDQSCHEYIEYMRNMDLATNPSPLQARHFDKCWLSRCWSRVQCFFKGVGGTSRELDWIWLPIEWLAHDWVTFGRQAPASWTLPFCTCRNWVTRPTRNTYVGTNKSTRSSVGSNATHGHVRLCACPFWAIEPWYGWYPPGHRWTTISAKPTFRKRHTSIPCSCLFFIAGPVCHTHMLIHSWIPIPGPVFSPTTFAESLLGPRAVPRAMQNWPHQASDPTRSLRTPADCGWEGEKLWSPSF